MKPVTCLLLLVATVLAVSADAQTLNWEPKAPLPFGRAGVVAGAVGDQVLVAGGRYWVAEGTAAWTSDLDVYDAAADRWGKGPSLPFAMSCGAGGVVGGKLYVVSGTDGASDFRNTLVYSPAGKASRWTAGPALPFPRLYAGSAVVGTRLFVIGGSPDNTMKKFGHRDMTVLDTVRLGAGWRSVGEVLGGPRIFPATAVVGDRIYVFGGSVQKGAEWAPSDNALYYDLAHGRWHRLPDMPRATLGATATVVDGRIYIAGGYAVWSWGSGRDDGLTADVLRFDPETETYEDAGALPLPLANSRAVTGPRGQPLLLGGYAGPNAAVDRVLAGKIQ
jgi:N-acetylneuraminic acid mutarotase